MKRERTAAQIPKAIDRGDVHIGHSPVSPIPMGRATATKSRISASAKRGFIEARLPAILAPMAKSLDRSGTIFKALWGAFAVQIAGRLMDSRWHATNDEFETGRDQITAHWLVWLGTLFVIAVAVWALLEARARAERRGYVVVLGANVLYVLVAVIHFIQHLDHQEVDWAHMSLAVTNIGSVVGVAMVTRAFLKRGVTQPGVEP